MKNLILFTILICFIEIIYAQKPGIGLTESGLKGKVKRVSAFIYRGDENIDTLGSPEKDTINFDEVGNQVDEVTYFAQGAMQKEIFNYLKGRIIVNQYYKDKLMAENIHIYDENDYEIEFDTDIEGDPSLRLAKSEYKVWYKYNAKGNRIEEITNGTFSTSANKTIYIYNEKNQKVESDSYLPDGKKSEKMKFYYDSFGNEIKVETYNPNGKLISDRTTSYSNFDAHGNWQLKKSMFKSYSEKLRVFSPASITKRQIIYFN